MGTYKHVSRLRSARLMGKEVASFYMLLGETQKSAAFLTDCLRTFEQDGWKELAAQTQVELAECCKKAGDTRKYIRSCAAVCSAPEMDNLIRWTYFDEMLKGLKLLEKTLIVPFKDIVKIVSVSVKNKLPVMQDCDVDVELVVESNFPREILCNEVLLSLEAENVELKKSKDKCSNNTITSKDLKPLDRSVCKLKIQRHFDYKEDKQLASASVVSVTAPLKRNDSSTPHFRSKFDSSLATDNKTVSLLL